MVRTADLKHRRNPADLEDLNSPVGAFVRDRCKLGPDEQVEIATLYKAYRDWCLENGHTPRTSHTFGKDLRSVRPEINRSRPRVGSGERAKLYTGINLRPENLHMGWAASHAAQNRGEDELGRVGRVPPQCNFAKCTACDGIGCPTCQPERFGLSPTRTRPAASLTRSRPCATPPSTQAESMKGEKMLLLIHDVAAAYRRKAACASRRRPCSVISNSTASNSSTTTRNQDESCPSLRR